MSWLIGIMQLVLHLWLCEEETHILGAFTFAPRRDSIDATHYPVFHQMEGVCLFTKEQAEAAGCTMEELAEKELKKTLEGLAKHLFGEYPTLAMAVIILVVL